MFNLMHKRKLDTTSTSITENNVAIQQLQNDIRKKQRLSIARNMRRTTKPPQVDVPVDREIDPKLSLIAMVIDRSYSMSSMGSEVEGGCNAYLDEQRATDKADGIETSVIFTTFDDKIEVIHDGVSLSSVPKVTREQVEPRGSTALYDGIGDTLLRTAQHLRNQKTMPGKVVVFILTDGHENRSRTWGAASVTAEIKRLSVAPFNFDFYFAAANQDALDKGASMGIPTAQCLDYDPTPGGIKQAMYSSSVAYTRSKRGQSKGFSYQERCLSSMNYSH
ncbi:hypothetical protein SARC_04888 [Sphaeroforma arctica JP610]|uniref:VWFA domain-containing protein n=1 Tax=Sphaeroforma arctica JP610 TaxID=667725 RepID=A0A0L0G1Y0_9EUKA|nr:hypothetical protein SARC_04888 [Sphaeroforma arctica JP610]KNC82841.1 hypothetical protein SARC_04888 [Sphaeroforma arctica JP610]|eukprot:XP_014156743.1 hypothetical protein SARC_04888 [Sphaeroforma arctica JP610]